ncbi:hypothetical protein X797_010317 [Metarhizium robertsii]|uniref:Uncharacterized protein n=1 Tax=Metarhizium robertsii TaxID=568076 RepID=A0A014P4M5_9HYPO|nr:hypothetical protein X797_010317 [Metarhizium robertsii]
MFWFRQYTFAGLLVATGTYASINLIPQTTPKPQPPKKSEAGPPLTPTPAPVFKRDKQHTCGYISGNPVVEFAGCAKVNDTAIPTTCVPFSYPLPDSTSRETLYCNQAAPSCAVLAFQDGGCSRCRFLYCGATGQTVPVYVHPTTATTSLPSPTPVGAIVGGVVGGIAGLAAIGLLAFFLLRRREKKRRQQTLISGSQAGSSQAPDYRSSNVTPPMSIATGTTSPAFRYLASFDETNMNPSTSSQPFHPSAQGQRNGSIGHNMPNAKPDKETHELSEIR